MSILKNIKQGVANSGSSKGKIVYFKPDTKTRIRFLHEVEDGLELTMHDSFNRGINIVCQREFDKECPHCDGGDDEVRTRQAYVWSVWDHDAKEVKLFMGFANNFNPLPSLIAMYEAYETLIDRDYIIQRDGKQTNTKYSVIPMDKKKFKNSNAKPYSEKKMMEIMNKAFPLNTSVEEDDDDEEEEDEKPKSKSKNKGSKKQSSNKKSKQDQDDEDDDEDEFDEDDEEDDDEQDYDYMSPKELYRECIERGLKVKKKMKKKYYISKLEEDDEEDDDWEDEDEDEEDGDW